MKHLVRAAATFAVFYGLGVFTAWDFNPADWDPAGRFAIAFIGLGCATFTYIVSVDGAFDDD